MSFVSSSQRVIGKGQYLWRCELLRGKSDIKEMKVKGVEESLIGMGKSWTGMYEGQNEGMR